MGAASSLSRGTWIEIAQRGAITEGLRPSSLSRGTWIEISLSAQEKQEVLCRPSHEGRGLKYLLPIHQQGVNGSSLSRGTWIEILWRTARPAERWGRPSHEGRGLKYTQPGSVGRGGGVVPLTRDVD